MFKVINGGQLPTRATKYSAAVDLYANADVKIPTGHTVIVSLGVCIDIDFNSIFKEWNNYTELMQEDKREEFLKTHYLQLEPRSSLRAKGLIIGTGIIDLDFPGEICLILHNPVKVEYSYTSGKLEIISSDFKISKGDKIAQILLCEHWSDLLGIESNNKRIGGIGSTNENN